MKPRLLPILAVVVAAATATAAEELRVESSAYRFDLGGMVPGAQAKGGFNLSNTGTAPAPVRLAPDNASRAFVALDRNAVTLDPGATAAFRFTYAVPRTAAPGEHGESLRIVLGPQDNASGTIQAATAILFTSRTLAAGVTAIEAPASVQPGEPLAGRVLVVNTGNAAVTAGVDVAVARAGEPPVASASLPPGDLAPNATRAYAFNLTLADGANGTFEVRARLANVTPPDAPVTQGAFAQPLVVGVLSISFELRDVRDNGDGTLSYTLVVQNTGTAPATARPRLTLAGAETDLDPFLLDPGASREISGTIRGPPGHQVLSVAQRPGDGPPIAAPPATASVLLAAPPAPPATRALPPFVLPLLGGVAVVALAGGFGMLLARSRKSPAAEAPAAAPASASRVAVLLDLTSLFGKERPRMKLGDVLAAALQGRAPVETPRAYYLARGKEEAARAHASIQRAGLVPIVRSERGAQAELAVALAVEATRLLARADALVLVTHDAALAPLAHAARKAGKRVEIVGFHDGVPLALANAAHDVRYLDAPAPEGAPPFE